MQRLVLIALLTLSPLPLLGEISFKGVLMMGPKTQVLLSKDAEAPASWHDVGSAVDGLLIQNYDKTTCLLTLKPSQGKAFAVLLEDAKTQDASPLEATATKPMPLDMERIGEILTAADDFEIAKKQILESVMKSGRRIATVNTLNGVETTTYTVPGFVLQTPPQQPALSMQIPAEKSAPVRLDRVINIY